MTNTTSTSTSKKWNDEAVAKLLSVVGSEAPVSQATVEAAAQELGVSSRSVASKLRQLDREVASLAKEKAPAFTQEQGQALKDFVEANANNLTYKEIAQHFEDGKFNAKQVQGKLLAMELTGLVKAAEKVAAQRAYTEAEEAKFISMAESGAFIEDIAEALGKEVPSVRGKALSLTRSGALTNIPAQKVSHATTLVDPVASLGDNVHNMTVAEIATATSKTERGIRTLLTRRGIKAADYDGLAKKQKAEAKAAA